VDIPGGAKAGEDYEAVEGVLKFADGESTKDINIKVMDDEAVEDDESFQVHIYDCTVEGAELAGGGICEITIVDDDEPGEIGFEKELTELVLKESTGKYMLKVKRFNGSAGTLTVKYKTECQKLKTMPTGDKRLAQPGLDFTAVEGHLEFGPGEIEKMVPIEILDDKMPDPKTVCFDVVLFDCVGPVDRACLTASTVSQITIVNDENTQAIMELARKLQAEMDEKYSPATSSWSQQFTDALTIEDEEDGTPPSHMTIVLHYVTLPWKLLFATCPPTSYGNGWVCFCVALLMIGVVTGFIGDLAELFGCAVGIPDQVTAITFVALGTSLPDTFASKAAALGDDSADAAVGNVTGSNAVNVFLGLGLPWMMAGAYWDLGTHDAEEIAYWGGLYWDSESAYLKKLVANGQVAFAVPAGSLGASVIIFVVCASACLSLIYYRRVTYGFELGGPKQQANRDGAILGCLWLVYILGSILTQ
jgi:solute carrier family 8 (sodium/calcium exchanger)